MQYKQMDKETETHRNTDRCTLCYFTARTDGSHAPQSLLEGCIYMETAIAIGQMLQEERYGNLLTHQTELHTNTLPESKCIYCINCI